MSWIRCRNRFLPAATFVLAVLPSLSSAQPPAWEERADFSIAGQTLAPTTAERLAKAEVLLVGAPAMTPVGNDFELDVNAWNLDLCVGEPFRGQPKVVSSVGGLNVANCSGTLIAPDKILTAGHCVDSTGGTTTLVGKDPSYDCGGPGFGGPPLYYFVFDWADQTDPISGPTTVTLDGDTVFECDHVLIDTHNSLFLGDFPPESSGDYAVIQLTESVPSSRLPMVTERIQRSFSGDSVALLGHPSGLPVKAEIAAMLNDTGSLSAHVLGGSSGTGVTSLGTGKISQVVTSGGTSWIFDPTPDDPPFCDEFDWEGPATGASGNLANNWNAWVDPIGLQVQMQNGADTLVYYGPPGSPADFEQLGVEVSVPVGSLPSGVTELEWAMPFSEVFEVVSGPNGGQFVEGQSVTIDVAPTQTTVASQGLVESEVVFIDSLYETREPVKAQAYVGIEGFTISPDSAFDGEGGLGLSDGDERTYVPRSRWIVWQDVTVSASDDWVTIDGFPGDASPQTYSVRPIYSRAPDIGVEIAVDADNLFPAEPGTYYGSVTFSADDSGVPAFTRSNEVVFDYCRQISVAALPWEEDIAPGASASHDLVLTTDPPVGATVGDVDVVVENTAKVLGQGFAPSYSVELVAPDGTAVMLKNFTQQQVVYYDQDRVTPLVRLDQDLEGVDAGPGPWQLRFTNNPNAMNSIRVTLDRWEVRLHTDEATTCSQ